MIYNKLRLFFIHLLFIISIPTFGQDWLISESSWTYCRFWAADSPQEYVYTQDSTINDTLYAVIRNVSINGESTIGSDYYENRTTLLRQSGDTTFRRVDNSEYVFFINGLDVGDGFNTYRAAAFYTSYYSCEPEMYLEVQDVYFEEIEGESFRHVVLKDTAFADVYGIPDDPTAENIFTFIEGIGLMNNFPYWNGSTFPYQIDMDFSCTLSTDGYLPLRLARYDNNSQEFVLFNCGLSSVDNPENLSIKLWPNPARDRIHLEGSEHIISVQLQDITGKTLLEENFGYGEKIIQLDDFQDGTYLLRCFSEKGVATNKVMIVGR